MIYDHRFTLIVVQRTLTGQLNADGILRHQVGLFTNDLPRAIFQLDNALPHTTGVAQDFIRHAQTLPYPAAPSACPLYSMCRIS